MSLKNVLQYPKSFLIFVIGQFVSNIGDWLLDIGLLLYIYQLLETKNSFALILFFKFLPKLFSPLFFYFNRLKNIKLFLFLLDFSRAILLIFMYYNMERNIITIYCSLFIFNFISGIFYTIRITFIPQLFDTKENYARGIAFFYSSANVSMIVGYILSGILMIYFSPKSFE